MNSHYDALKKLFPARDMTGELDNDLTIEGKYLDLVDSSATLLSAEFYPDTALTLLSDWERVFDTTASGISARRAAIVAAERVLVNKDGRLNPSYYLDLADGMGYDSTIHEGAAMFIVAGTTPPATVLPGVLWGAEALWMWTMDSTGSTTPNDRTSLMNLIIERAPAFTKVDFGFN